VTKRTLGSSAPKVKIKDVGHMMIIIMRIPRCHTPTYTVLTTI
jgi:hypothetical protein